ncbi:MAG: tRNA (adenosine(37)-N6)-threonylcarbamoyltransferase complex dimerization subunit type 1 TsaB [Rhodobacteraceae bacterium]|nr:tRNA (adenosine(37)-N6)-threonylcarbamoyltransferase complex dimerization subunit type 1 TsaB [Paracoccaceae bacterium]
MAFDTSAAHCAALLLWGDDILSHKHEEMAKGQVERLFPLLEEVLALGKSSWSDLDTIGVCTGPGNFTGVRIAVSSARGLSLSLGIPAIGVTMLEALAHGQTGPSTSVLDARRDRLFVQDFVDGTAAGAPGLVELEKLDLTGTQINSTAPLTIPCSAQHIPQTPVKAVAKIAAQRLRLNNPRPAPLYLRAPNAALPTEQPPPLLP